MLSNKVLFHLRSARFAAEEVVSLLAPYCHRIQIAGSIRREVKEVHDIDLVVWPHYQETGQLNIFENNPSLEPVEIVKAIKKNSEFEDFTGERCSKILRFRYQYFPVEIFLVEPDGRNWEAMLQMRTGSATFNIRLGSEAKKLGLMYRAGYGVFKPISGVRVDDGTEAGILKVLGISSYYLDPKVRIS